jgi:hypothetical protein
VAVAERARFAEHADHFILSGNKMHRGASIVYGCENSRYGLAAVGAG